MAEIKVYAVGTGNVDPLKRKSRQAVKYCSKLNGLVGVHPHYPDGTLWLFDTENNAKIAKNKMESRGILTGRNICEVFIDEKYLKEKDNADNR